jgi:uncharacterized delta-60 repeat protein
MLYFKKIISVLFFVLFLKNSQCFDTTFGTTNTGYETTLINNFSQINSIAIQADGKIIAGGYSTNLNLENLFAIAKYNSNGTIDTNFGSNGIVTTLVGTSCVINAIAIQTDGKIIVAGYTLDNVSKIALARYESNGALDNTFGDNGIVKTSINQAANANSVKILNDGSILIGGLSILNGQSILALAKYESNGTPDNTFGNNGIVTKSINYQSSINDIAIQEDGKIIVGGSNYNGSVNQIILGRFNVDGSDDTSFGSSGVTLTSISNNALINKIVLDNDGNIFAAGKTGQNPNEKFVLAKYTSSGNLDTTFNTTGYVLTTIGASPVANDIKIQADNKIVLGGASSNNNVNQFALIRYNTDGSLDSTFGNLGKLTILISDSSGINSIAIQTDGNVVVGGSSYNKISDITKFTIARFVKSNVNSISITAPANNSTQYRKFLRFSGTSTGNISTVRVYLDNVLFSTVSTDASGNWSTSLTSLLAEGLHNVKAELIDESLNVLATDVNNFTVDTCIVSQFSNGNILRVDKTFGNDSTGVRGGSPFMTISGALALAQSGDLVFITPGTYEESFTIPDGVSVRGLSSELCIISKFVSSNADLVTMGNNTRLENVKLKLTSATHVDLRGIVFPGATAQTSIVKDVIVSINNAAAGLVGTSNIYGIHSNGTGTPDDSIQNIQNSVIVTLSGGSGNKRAVLVDSESYLNIFSSVIVSVSIGGSGTFYGAETNNPSSKITARGCTILGSTSDISQTAGNIILSMTALETMTTNNNPFTCNMLTNFMLWADTGTLPTGISFMRPGTASVSATEIKFKLPRKVIVKSMYVRAVTAPGSSVTDTWTVLKNSVATSMSVSLTDSQQENSNTTNAISFNAGDYISIQVNKDALSATSDVIVCLELF